MPKLVMLIEDNATDEKLTLLALRGCGIPHQILVERDGAAALDYLFATGKHAGRDLSVQPTVILLDLKLPRIGGLEVLRRIRADERTKLVPVVILTASTQDEDIARGYAVGANAYVGKPVDFVEFAAAAKTLGVFWLQMNEAPPRVAKAS
jgi:two-component system response regulator